MADLVGFVGFVFGRSSLVAMVGGLVAWRWLRKYAAARKGAATRNRRKMSPDSMVENVVPMINFLLERDDVQRDDRDLTVNHQRKVTPGKQKQSTKICFVYTD